MTLPRKERDENLILALVLMLEQLGDKYTSSAEGVFDTADPRFASIGRSTWAEMEDERFLCRDEEIGSPSRRYLFTGDGWYCAHERLGRTENGGEFVTKLSRVSRALKDCIKPDGREEAVERPAIIAEGRMRAQA